jgi:ABC-type ATPase involved in cell division
MSTHARSDVVGPVAELRGVTKRYGAVAALDRVDLALAPGEVTALLGPNGAGKTTSVRLMLGLVKPSAGTALLFGGDPLAARNRRRTGVMLQISKVPETLKVVEHIHLFSSYYPNPMAMDEIVELAGLTGIENRKFGELSGGQRQRVLFALAICGNPNLLFRGAPSGRRSATSPVAGARSSSRRTTSKRRTRSRTASSSSTGGRSSRTEPPPRSRLAPRANRSGAGLDSRTVTSSRFPA